METKSKVTTLVLKSASAVRRIEKTRKAAKRPPVLYLLRATDDDGQGLPENATVTH